MSELIEEYEEPKTHSIVTEDCKLRINHIGTPVTYQSVTGLLIKYVPTCKHNLLELSTSEAIECLSAPAETEE